MDVSVDSSQSSSTNTATSSSTSPALSFVNLFLNEVNNQDSHGLLDVQRSFLEQLDKTNEKLDGINKISAKRYLDATRDFSSHIHILTTMKSDLDLISKRIKILKIRLNKKYPAAYESVIRMNKTQNDYLDDEDDDMNDFTTSTTRYATSSSLVKSKTIDMSQFSASLRESHSSAELSSINEQSANSFGAVRRFILDKSSGGQNLSTMFKNARDEIKKINDGFLGGQNSKPPNDNEQ
ncbi:unnamed protein product [Rotaria socialis]|uniref:KxDL domain-containing protein n=1 Tax=Rotaria socialis TaxID=392032 RepID=A0A821PEJ3_9BILA|nr:unnamed protein product [Rotaria socialis]CAF3435773.1 unnamed protein product [Rotaria socialis]CAF3444030.1 unnamed protein product [Rotaria socialis]CAF3544485.1 unnamed protein product [Rotaria socialis]CAF3645201.1 unnamed protein product [Rotaria socialis]